MSEIINENAVSRQIVEWALSTGRRLQSAQTGFIHYHAGGLLDAIHHTIPLYENALFILVLYRSRLVPHAKEAKELLTRILAFQLPCGLFPVYLHDYPQSRDEVANILLVAPLYWIYRLFGYVLGDEPRCALETSLTQLMECLEKNTRDKPRSVVFQIRLAAASVALGHLFNRKDWTERGQLTLKELATEFPLSHWVSTTTIGHLLVAFTMLDQAYIEELWPGWLIFLKQTWHRNLHTYCGPCVKEWHDAGEPVPGLYDLFLSSWQGQFAQRMTILQHYHLEGALVLPILPIWTEAMQNGEWHGEWMGQSWISRWGSDWACTLLEKHQLQNDTLERTYSPIRLMWGNDLHASTLVCQGGHVSQVTYRWREDKIELDFTLGSPQLDTGKQGERPICFYITAHPSLSLKIADRSTMMFDLNQTVTLHLAMHDCLNISFALIKGEGQFCGHWQPGQRPSQKIKSEGVPGEWTLFLRTIRRQAECVIRVTLSSQLLTADQHPMNHIA